MNICIITEYFPHSNKLEIKGGVEVCAFNEAEQLSKKHNVTILTSNDEINNDDFYINNIHVISCGDKRTYVQKGSLIKRLKFMKESKKIGYSLKDIDIIIGYNFITYPIAWFISQKLKIPVIARYHDVWIGEWIKNIGITGIFGEITERYILKKNFNLIIPVSDYTKNNLKKYFPENKIKTVHNIVDFPLVKSDKYHNITISCVARLVEYKRVKDLIKAVNIIKKTIPSIQCKIIGTGPLEENLKKLTKELNLENNIEFLGFVEKHEDVLKVINSSDVFCLPSIVEGFGIVIIEALSLKTPFVASYIPPIVEASGKKGGLFYEPKNYKQLSQCLLTLINNKKIYNTFQKEGYIQSKEYTKEAIGRKLNELINSIKK